jgi:hypothetical protein
MPERYKQIDNRLRQIKSRISEIEKLFIKATEQFKSDTTLESVYKKYSKYLSNEYKKLLEEEKQLLDVRKRIKYEIQTAKIFEPYNRHMKIEILKIRKQAMKEHILRIVNTYIHELIMTGGFKRAIRLIDSKKILDRIFDNCLSKKYNEEDIIKLVVTEIINEYNDQQIKNYSPKNKKVARLNIRKTKRKNRKSRYL